MLSQSEAQSYEQQSVERTGCVMCAKSLQENEVYACEECVIESYVEVNIVEAKE